MTRIVPGRWLPLSLALLCLASCQSARKGSAETASRHTALRAALGTTFRLTVYAPDPKKQNEAIAAAWRRLDEVDAALNGEKAGSELAALNAAAEGVPVKLGDDLFAVLQHAQRLAATTRGAFDVTAGPYIDLWRRAAEARRAPTTVELEQARLRVGWDKLTLNSIERTATLTVPRMRIDLSGIARGYAADQVYRQLRAHGCELAKVEAGNVMVLGDPPPGREGWPVEMEGIVGTAAKPRRVPLTRTALSFSPNTRVHRSSEPPAGAGIPRLIDPVGGRDIGDRPPAAVLATSATAAQSAACAAVVLGPTGTDVLAAADGAARVRFGPPPGERRPGR